MAQICGKRLNFVRNDLDLLEITQICDKWLSCVGNGLNLWEMAQKYDKWILCVGNCCVSLVSTRKEAR